MRLALIAIVALVISGAANAQEDPKIIIYRQLLTEANERIVGFAAQLQAAQAEIAKLKGEVKPDAAKPEAAKPDSK